MNDSEKRLKKKIQLAVIGGITLLFALVTVLVFQFAVRINQRGLEKDLKSEQARLQRAIDDAELDIRYYQSSDFVDDYALKVLGWGKSGQEVFK